uniref:Cyclin-like domain-containing protein n=1 Tax=Timema douglasi TaxID=61478 RepID=A0A7R8Z710_TIMDO|nr:unnamed protein product [Timema douglasi]
MCTNALCQYGPYTTGFHSKLQTKPKCNKRKLSSRRTQENVKLKKSETILTVKNEKVEKANKAIKDVNKIVPISRFLNKVENREVVKPEPKSYSSQRLEGNLKDIDKLSGDCQILLGYYAEDIYSYLRDLEDNYSPVVCPALPNFIIIPRCLEDLLSHGVSDSVMKIEIKFPISPTFMSELLINSKMRSILVDWLVEVHQQFALLPETLYVTISILDRFLQIEKTVQRKYLQLVGISAMFLACKYEEMCSPDVQDFVYISDSAYSKEQIFKMEQHILMKLEFKLGRPVPLHFLRRFSRAADASSEQHAMAKYLMELCLVEYDLCHYAPSMIAAAALYLSLRYK